MQTVVDLPFFIFVKYIHKVIKGKYKKKINELINFIVYILRV